MKVAILAGGFGTRIPEYTKDIPKPMIPIKGEPILIKIIKIYLRFNIKSFVIATGYKNEVIENYFINNKNFKSYIIKSKKKKKFLFQIGKKICEICLYYTGKNTLTGGRLKKIKDEFEKNKTFMMTYGDGIADININNLIRFHIKHKNLATITAVHPIGRFGMLEINNRNVVKKFEEKKQTKKDWINGGFFVFEYDIFKYLKSDKTILEQKPLETLSKKKKLFAFKHHNFWMCMDTKRDLNNLKKVYNKYFE